MMKILHTSDWHIGAELEGHSRAEEHVAFLSWLLTLLRQEAVDVLLMAGDIFHQSHPSAAAQAMFFDFVKQLESIETLRHAVFIGGNHDSPSRLDAPIPLFLTRQVTMIGGYTKEREDDMLVPIVGDSGEVETVIVAVPYVHEVRLGVGAGERNADALRSATVDAFRQLYTRLGECAASRWPKATIVGMGHLTCGEATDDDYGTPLHNIGTIESLPDTIFDPRLYRYVALGHIHRGYRIGGGIANYAGSPLTLRFNASELSPRNVVMVDADSGESTRIRVPTTRTLLSIVGEQNQVEQQLRAIVHVSPLETWVSITLMTDERMLDPLSYFRELAPNNVYVIQVQQKRATVRDVSMELDDLPDLRAMKPRDVFKELYRFEFGQEDVPDDLLQKFDQATVTVQAEEHQ